MKDGKDPGEFICEFSVSNVKTFMGLSQRGLKELFFEKKGCRISRLRETIEKKTLAG